MAISGGNPNGFPDFRPQNPWGRRMPKPVRPIQDRPQSELLFQVHVELRNGQMLAVGPKMPEKFANVFREAILVQIIHGKEKSWSNPTVLPAPTM